MVWLAMDAIRAMNTRRNSFSRDREKVCLVYKSAVIAMQEPRTWLAKHPTDCLIRSFKEFKDE